MRRTPFIAGLIVLCGLGLLPRLWNLGAQVLGDDEVHSVRSALGRPVSHILVTYELTDNCIPLTAFWRMLLDAGVRPDEQMLRLPAVVSGALLLLVAPAWAAWRIGRGPALVFAGLLALSPGLVIYSRIARSYAPVVLLGFGAVAAFEAWWRRPSWRMGAVYVGLAALAAWFHLGAATFVVAPFLFAVADLLVHRTTQRLRALLGLGLATGLAFLAFLVPALESLLFLILSKQASSGVGLAAAWDVLQLFAGSRRVWVTAAFWLVAAAGCVLLARSERRLALYVATVALGHLAGLLWLAPEGYQSPLVLHRYLLVVLPWVLLGPAVALGRGRAAPLLAAGALAVLVAAGPLAERAHWRTSFPHHNDHLGFFAARPVPRPRQVPAFYRKLAADGGSEAVLEFPWISIWRVNRSLYLYQEVHGREVVVSSPRKVLDDPRLDLDNQVPADPSTFLASRARWLVVHRDLGAEEARWAEPVAFPQPQVLPRLSPMFRRVGPDMIRRLRRAWGDPDHTDRWVVVWDLERVRKKRQPPMR